MTEQLPPREVTGVPLRLPLQRLAVLSRQLATLLTAGVPLLVSLESLQRGCESAGEEKLLEHLATQLSKGWRLSNALGQHPTIFPTIYRAVVRTGEETGRLVYCLERLSFWLEEELRQRRALTGALIYPLFILGLTLLLTAALLTWVLPGLLQGLQGQALPWPTRLLMGVVKLCQRPAVWMVVLALFSELFLATRNLGKNRRRHRLVYQQLLRVPALGNVLLESSLVRFCAGLQVALSAGSLLQPALSLAAETSANPVLQAAVQEVLLEVRSGEDLMACLESRPNAFPNLFIQFMRVGMESGKLASMLQHLESAYQDSLSLRMERMQALLEPLLLGFVSLLVATIVLAVFLPLYSTLSVLGS